jgi:predicted transcriptional regulator
MMDRMQIYLETEQRLRLNALSRALRRPTAELIRDAVDRYLAEQSQSRTIHCSSSLAQPAVSKRRPT